MKKIGMLLITFLFIFFIKINIYKAIDCSSEEYACAVCTYSEDTFGASITYTLVSDGTSVKISRTGDKWKKGFLKAEHEIANDAIIISNFENGSKLKCLSSIFLSAQSIDTRPVNIYANRPTYNLVSEAKLASSQNNNKNIYNTNATKPKSCTFNVYNQGSTGINISEGDFTTGNVAGRIGTVTITSNGARILSTVFSNSALSLDGKDYSSFAQKINNNEDCPEIFVLCQKNVCSLLNYIPSELKNAERIKKEGNYSLSISNYEEASKVPTVNVPNHNCTSLLGDPAKSNPPSPAFLLSYAFKVLRYVAIILLVVLSIMDFVSSVSSQDTDSLKKAVNKTIRRAILCVIIFLLPYLIEYVLTFLNDNATKICINT